MRRARVKATFCVGKKKTVSSQKVIENQDEKCDSSEQKVNSLNVEQKLAQESQDEQVKPPEMVISNTEFTSKESSKTPIMHQENPNPTEHSNIPIVSKFPSSSTNSVTPEPLKENSIPNEQVKPPEMVISNTEFTSKESSKTPIIHQENPNPTEHSNIPIVSKFPSSSTNSVTPEPLKENSIPVINCGLMNRSKFKVVPKLKGRKTCSKSISSEITESKTHFVPTTTQESLNTPCLQESTSNSSAKCSSSENVTSPLNCINSILPLSPSKIKSISALENRHFSGSSDLKDGSETINSGIRTQSVSASNTCLQDSTSNSPAKCSLSENVSSPVNYVPPLSPSKICRSKKKVIPVLGNRKHFSSTSDSEDGSKRITSRTRTESQCSNISGIQETTLEQTSILKKNEYTAEIKKKCRKTEASKKLEEARKEFAKKYVNCKPDHKKLTMMDLIFYNPTTNPMRNEKKKVKVGSEISEEEENVDNPSEIGNDDSSRKDEGNAEKSDEEEERIAPRIKIGPNGEIVLDEKSLVIENKKTKKALEEIAKSKAIDGDSDRSYGFYKRFKRPKDWSKSETVKFYRALSTVGTDFSLMNELFPKRSRRELKMKFKKEEKTNQALIDQAIMKPCNFNFEELKSEFQLMEIEELEIEQQQLNNLNKKKQNKKSSKLSKITQESNSYDDVEISHGDATNSKVVTSVHEKSLKKKGQKPQNPKQPKHPKKLDILSVLSSESDHSDEASVDSEELPFWNSTQTTRYGRKTKKRKMYEPNIDTDENLIETIPKKIRKTNPEPEPLQKPGSLMVVSSETTDGKPMVQIYMVTDDKANNSNQKEVNNKNLLPIAMIRTGHTDDEAEEEIVENNYTIPAE